MYVARGSERTTEQQSPRAFISCHEAGHGSGCAGLELTLKLLQRVALLEGVQHILDCRAHCSDVLAAIDLQRTRTLLFALCMPGELSRNESMQVQ